MKFRDLQTMGYSAHTTIRGLFEMLCQNYCECGQGYDILDNSDGKSKCRNCWRLSNIDNISQKEMLKYIEEHEYEMELSDEEIEILWFYFKKTTMKEKDDKILLCGDFFIWGKGTEKADIWGWFNVNYSKGLSFLVNEFEELSSISKYTFDGINFIEIETI